MHLNSDIILHLEIFYVNAMAIFEGKLMFVKKKIHIFSVKCENSYQGELHCKKDL